MTGNIDVRDAARLMNKSDMFVRIGLQRGVLPIGTAIKTSSKYSYFISPKLLEDYLGINIDESKLLCTNRRKQNKIE